ncbi:NADH-quinone oxidoreductase subunit B family protein [Nigerium massiliense]|uniref:NADH-quinone oxidoreductase subunit B family protein n=1 Tax=Nigerium massiliense TaxID=1522317 RepID=UPI0005904A95|nr:hypothetical protein [Nigerium massiliense]
MRYWDWFGDGSLVVCDLGLACCVVELEAAALGRVRLDAAPDGAQVAVVVAGTVTDAVAPLVRKRVADQPGDPIVIAFGACASAGGPYWDSPVVTKGVDQLVAVDHYVPGCPPSPGALDEVFAAHAR